MIKKKLTNLQENILRLLYINTGRIFNARNLATKLNVSQPAISKALPTLAEQDLILIQKDKESNQLKITLKSENPKIIKLKRAENLKMLYESGITEHLEENYPGATIILFGSYSFGEDTTKSDIDIAVIGSKEKNLSLKEFEEKLEKEIRITFFKNWDEINKNLKDNILNGIVFVGGIEL